ILVITRSQLFLPHDDEVEDFRALFLDKAAIVAQLALAVPMSVDLLRIAFSSKPLLNVDVILLSILGHDQLRLGLRLGLRSLLSGRRGSLALRVCFGQGFLNTALCEPFDGDLCRL